MYDHIHGIREVEDIGRLGVERVLEEQHLGIVRHHPVLVGNGDGVRGPEAVLGRTHEAGLQVHDQREVTEAHLDSVEAMGSTRSVEGIGVDVESSEEFFEREGGMGRGNGARGNRFRVGGLAVDDFAGGRNVGIVEDEAVL